MLLWIINRNVLQQLQLKETHSYGSSTSAKREESTISMPITLEASLFALDGSASVQKTSLTINL